MIRATTALAGLAAGVYGAWRLLELGRNNFVATLTWLVGGVVLHDALLAPVIIVVVVVAVRFVPRHRLSPWTVALVVLTPVTILSIPVLGRFGARRTEPSLLDRHYWLGWWGLVLVAVVAILVGMFVRRVSIRSRPTAGGVRGQGHGGR